jgi:hypothetical protein
VIWISGFSVTAESEMLGEAGAQSSWLLTWWDFSGQECTSKEAAFIIFGFSVSEIAACWIIMILISNNSRWWILHA